MNQNKNLEDEKPTRGLVDKLPKDKGILSDHPLFREKKPMKWEDVSQEYWIQKFKKRKRQLAMSKAETVLTDSKNLQRSTRRFAEPQDSPSPQPHKIFDPNDHQPTQIHDLENTNVPSIESYLYEEGNNIGPFIIGKKLGEGGMGGIYPLIKGHQIYILKIPLKAGIQKTTLENEINVLNHIKKQTKKLKKQGKLTFEPKIIKLYASSQGKYTYAILEPLESSVEGKSQDTKFRNQNLRRIYVAPKNTIQGQQPVRVAKYIHDVAESLEFLHSIEVTHGDIKYHNCMDTHRNGKLEFIIFDFGLSKILTDENESNIRNLTLFGGTPHYITKNLIEDFLRYEAPGNIGHPTFYQNCPMRQMRTILKKADWDALALSAYHLLTGVSPYSLTHKAPVDGEYTCVLNFAEDPLTEIVDFQGDPIDDKIVKKCQHGDTFVKTFKKLRDPSILFPEKRNEIYKLFRRTFKQPELFE